MSNPRTGRMTISPEYLARLIGVEPDQVIAGARMTDVGELEFLIVGDRMPEKIDGEPIERVQIMFSQTYDDTGFKTLSAYWSHAPNMFPWQVAPRVPGK